MIVGDIGTLIELETGETLTGGDNALIYYQKPSGDTGSWTGVVDGSKITYTTAAVTDIDEPGPWKLQGYVELSTPWKGKTVVIQMDVDTGI